MAQDHVLEPQQQLGRKRLARQVGHLGGLFVEHLHADDQVADQAGPRRCRRTPGRKLSSRTLPMSCRKMPIEQQIAVQLRVERQQPLGGVQQGHDVLEQAAQVGVVVANAGRVPGRKPRTKSSSIRKHSARARRCGLAMLHAGWPAQPFQQLADVLFGVRQEIAKVDLFRLARARCG